MRGNDSFYQIFSLTARNQLSSASRTGTLTVAGMTGGAISSLSVNGVSAIVYADGSFAARGLAAVASYTATAQGAAGNTATDSISVSFPDTVAFTHDANGNLTSDGLRTFSYDDENQLISVQISGQGRVDYTYDGLGRRRFRREYDAAGNLVKTTRCLYDGMCVIQERDGNDQVTVHYTRGLDLSGSLEGAGGSADCWPERMPRARPTTTLMLGAM